MREGERVFLALIDGKEGLSLAGNGPYHRYLRKPQCIRSKDSLPFPHPTACLMVRRSYYALVHFDDFSSRLKEPYIFTGGNLLLEQVLVVVVVLPYYSYLAVAHAELLLDVFAE